MLVKYTRHPCLSLSGLIIALMICYYHFLRWTWQITCKCAWHDIKLWIKCFCFISMWMQEYQSCNTLPCPDLKKTTPWTPWTPVNISDNGGHYEQRFRYTCKARIPDSSLLEVGRQRIEMRYCSSDGSTGCSTDGECRIFPVIPASGYFWLSGSSCLSASLQANYWRPSLKPILLHVCFCCLPPQSFPLSVL